MSKQTFGWAFTIGLAAVIGVGWGFVGASPLALFMTTAIGGVYLLGAAELRRFRLDTVGLAAALEAIPQPLSRLDDWLAHLPAALRPAVRLRVEGERAALPGPALTPYLVGLLVMLGMLGTFLGMVLTFRGTVFALEATGDLQAMRSVLAEPIKGLGLAFGTSVAGVAASAMLGLMSAIARRERHAVARRLDAEVAGTLRPFSRVHQREESLRALQSQAAALPAVAQQLGALMDRIDARSRALDAQLQERQDRFHREAAQAYTGLAQAVGRSLEDSLAAGGRAAGESIRPVVEAAMARVVQETGRLHAHLGEASQAQAADLSRQLEATTRTVSTTWTDAVQAHERTSGALAAQLQEALGAAAQSLERRGAELVTTVQGDLARTQAALAAAERERVQAWTGELERMAGALHAQWQQAGADARERQQAVCEALEHSATGIVERTQEQAGRTLEAVSQLLERSESLVRSREQTEAQRVAQHGERLDQLEATWRTQLSALRDEEAARGAAAVARLGELQAAVAQHLGTLGAALEAPLTRLLHTAAEVPQAAAGVIAQLREEMGRVGERDNLALQERTALLAQLGELLQALRRGADEQRSATQALVASASTVLDDAGQRFARTLETQAADTRDVAAHVGASAVELASLGEAFGEGVQLFHAGNEQLLQTLQRIEAAITRSTARSDEQLAYYVSQAREVIDLSIASQQGLVADLRRIQVPRVEPEASAAHA